MGHKGADTFFFNSADSDIDRISDFNTTEGDRIQISANSFGGNLTIGVLEANYFVFGSTAINESDRFIYNQDTGSLFFDLDGSGTSEAVEIASLHNHTALNHDDIVIV